MKGKKIILYIFLPATLLSAFIMLKKYNEFSSLCLKEVHISVDVGAERYLIDILGNKIENFMYKEGFKRFGPNIGIFYALPRENFDFVYNTVVKRAEFLKSITPSFEYFLLSWAEMLKEEILTSNPDYIMEESIKNLLLAFSKLVEISMLIIDGKEISAEIYSRYIEDILIPKTMESVFLERGFSVAELGNKAVFSFKNEFGFLESLVKYIKVGKFISSLSSKFGVKFELTFLPFRKENDIFRDVNGYYPYPFCVENINEKVYPYLSSVFLRNKEFHHSDDRKNYIEKLKETVYEILNNMDENTAENKNVEEINLRAFNIIMRALGIIEKNFLAIYQMGNAIGWNISREKNIAVESLRRFKEKMKSSSNLQKINDVFKDSVKVMKRNIELKFMEPKRKKRNMNIIYPKVDISQKDMRRIFYEELKILTRKTDFK